MAASDNLNQQLFHGTGGEIIGDVIHPGERKAAGPGAYATTSLDWAEKFARGKANKEGRLFGTIYEVEPVSEAIPFNASRKDEDFFRDPEGLRIKKAVRFPINTMIAD